MQRPIGVTITAILMVLNVFADIALSLISPSVELANTHSSGPGLSATVIIVHVVLIAFTVFQCTVVFFYWLGRPWSRWFVLVGCLFYLTGLRYLPRQWHQSHPSAALTVGSAVLAFYLIWYIHTDVVRAWMTRPRAVYATDK
jgi:hypothetical protein